ncbi:MAG: ABC transporter permease, partial [Butyricicoccus sp.]
MSKKKFGGLGQYIGTVGALLILCVILTIVSDTFLTYNNIMSILKQTTFTALTAAGMLLCLITAGIDLSVGANAIFCACMVGMLLNKGVDNAFLLIIVPLIAGTAIGLINGLLLTRL